MYQPKMFIIDLKREQKQRTSTVLVQLMQWTISEASLAVPWFVADIRDAVSAHSVKVHSIVSLLYLHFMLVCNFSKGNPNRRVDSCTGEVGQSDM